MRTLAQSLCRAVVSLCWPVSMAAQVMVGRVVLPDSTTPVVGAIVVASDATGATLARTLTSQRGEFVIRMSAAGPVRLTVLRIGFRPTHAPVVHVAAGATERIRIIATAAAVTLTGLSVRERETCRVSIDTGLAVARVWEEARKAMLTSQLSADGPPLFAEWIEYDRTLDSASRVVRRQSIRTSRHPTTHAFRSAPADVLRERGFVVPEEGSTTFHAPDAAVLLSDDFVSGHCFHLVAAPPDSGDVIGVGFVPTRDRRAMLEIEGTLWIDRASAELRRVDFLFLNLPDAAAPARPGGEVVFRRLADGNWFVSRWSVRMPLLRAPDRTSNNGLGRTVFSTTSAVLRAVQVTGGEVVRAVSRDSVVYLATGPSVVLQILAHDSIASTSGATVTLDGTDYQGSADSLGRIRISPVLEGRYVASIRTPFMDAVGLPPVLRQVETRTGARVDSLVLPGAGAALAGACPRDSIRDGEGLLHGRVRDERSQVVAGALVTATWAEAFTMLGASDGQRLHYNERTIQARTDAAGRWKMCGVPRGAVPVLTVANDSTFDRQRVRMADRPIVTVELALHRPLSSGGELEKLKRPAELSLVEVVVTDSRGLPLAETSLDVDGAGRGTRTVVTGATGTALIAEVARGRLTIRARRIGFHAGIVRMDVDSALVAVRIVMSSLAAPMLDTLRVVGRRTENMRHSAFETRRAARQATVSLTRDDIERRNPTDIWEMLTTVPGVKVVDFDEMVAAMSTRALVDRFDNAPCYLRAMVDGVMLVTDLKGRFDLRQLPRPADIHGVEVFNGPASVPLEYGGTGNRKWCGLIAIWTR